MVRVRLRRATRAGVVTFGPSHGGGDSSPGGRMLARQKGITVLLPGSLELRIGWGQPHVDGLVAHPHHAAHYRSARACQDITDSFANQSIVSRKCITSSPLPK